MDFLESIITHVICSAVNAQAVLKGTNVDGVYDCNSRDNNFTFEHISFRELVSRGVTSMDMSALTFCEENAIPGKQYYCIWSFYGRVSGCAALDIVQYTIQCIVILHVPCSGFQISPVAYLNI